MRPTSLLLLVVVSALVGTGAGWILRGALESEHAPVAAKEIAPDAEREEPRAPQVLLAGEADAGSPTRASAVTTTAPTAAPVSSGASTIFGRVHDALKRPIEGATVRATLGDRTLSAKVDETTGDYLLEGLAPGRWELEPWARGWTGAGQGLELFGDARSHRLDFELVPSPRIRVTLVNSAGQAVDWSTLEDQALIHFMVFAFEGEPPNDPARRLEESVGRTEEVRGQVDLIPIRPLPLTALLTAGGLELGSRVVHPGEDQVEFVVDIDAILARAPSLELTVVDDETGEPLSASVSLEHKDIGSSISASTRKGRRRFKSVSTGTCQLSVVAQGHAPYIRTLVIPEGARMDLGTIRLAACTTVVGRVLDSMGAPVPNIRIQPLDPTSGEGVSTQQAVHSDEEGRFELSWLPEAGALLTGKRSNRRGGRVESVLRVHTCLARPDSGELELLAEPATQVLIENRGERGTLKLFDREGYPVEVGSLFRTRSFWLLPGEYTAQVWVDDQERSRTNFSVGVEWTRVIVD